MWIKHRADQAGSLRLSIEMEFNFGLFFGLAVALYESTLVADQTPFDQWMETGRFNGSFGKRALAGLNLFVNQGQCISCHAGPELTKASVREAQGKNLIRAMAMAQGSSLYDNGFYNISVTPTTDDIGRGGQDPFNPPRPLAFARQTLFNRLGIATIDFPILGNDQIPAKDEDLGSPVCEDANANGVCEPSETILPEFQRVAVDGAFKTPGLRNSALTGPYFHNGGMATLRQVVQFYNRGGNFCSFNLRDLDPTIRPLGLTPSQEKQLVAFLISLTDERVRYRQAPFDHPELRVPDDGLATAHPVAALISGRIISASLHLDQPVEKGDVLVELDASSEKLRLQEEESRLKALPPQITSLQKEIASQELAGREDHQAALSAAQAARARHHEAIAAAEFAKDHEGRLSKLSGSGRVPLIDVLRVRAEAHKMRAAADAFSSEIRRVEMDARTRAHQKQAEVEQLKRTAATLQAQVSTTEATIARLRQDIEKHVIRSPVTGRVGDVGPLQEGSYVGEGDKLGSIVPTGALRIVADFAPASVLGRIHPGQMSRMRLDGFPWVRPK